MNLLNQLNFLQTINRLCELLSRYRHQEPVGLSDLCVLVVCARATTSNYSCCSHLGLLNILAIRAPYQARGQAFFMPATERIMTNKDFARAERPDTIYSDPESQPGPIRRRRPTTTPDDTARTLMSQSRAKSRLEAIAERQRQARKPLAIPAPDPRLYDIALRQGRYRPSTGPSTVTRLTAPRRYDGVDHASTSNSTSDVLVIPGDINVPMRSFDNGSTPLPSEVTDVTDAGLVSIVSPGTRFL